MSTRSRAFFWPSAVLGLLVAACGGSVGPSPSGGTDGPGTTSPDPTRNPSQTPDAKPDARPLALEGSFDLRFTQVSVAPTSPSSYTPPSDPPSKTTSFRLDLEREASGVLRGALTARWGVIALATITEDAKALTLKGDFTASGPVAGGGGGVSDRWVSLTLPRTKDGSLAGTFSATGDETIFQGDAGYSLNLTGQGTLTTDITAPEARVIASSTAGPADKLLPWDSISFQLAEPIAQSDAVAASHVAGPGGAALALAWAAKSPQASDWVGVTTVSSRAKTWPASVSWNGVVETLTDRVGLKSPRVSKPIELLPLPPAASTIGFDDDVLMASTWGAVDLLGGGLTGANDSRCEAGGCARLTMDTSSGCSAGAAGLLVQLTPGAQRKASVRYRVLAHPKYTGTTPYLPSVMLVESAVEGGEPKQDRVYTGSTGGPALTALPASIDQYDWATPWTTLEVTLPSGAGRVGVAISGVPNAYCGGPPLPPADVAVLIESVSAK